MPPALRSVLVTCHSSHVTSCTVDRSPFPSTRPACRSAPPEWIRSFRPERSHVDRETVLHIGLEQSFVSFVDFLDRNDFDIGGDVMLAAKIEHLLGFGDAADGRARETAAPHDEAECRNHDRLSGSADQRKIAVDAE